MCARWFAGARGGRGFGVGRAGGGGLGARGEAAELLDIVDPKGDEAKKR